MKKYFGSFKDINENNIYVDIIPTGTYTEEVEVTFTGEDPVLIELNSDEIFLPVKDLSATITLFTDDIFWDLYAGSVTTYYVHIYNDSISLFDGYLSPCIYTQDYTYMASLELEAVDFLAVLDQFDYKCDTCQIVTVDALLTKIFANIPNYSGYVNKSTIDFTKYNLQEANFFDDNDEPSTCKEIIEELCRYLGITATMYNGKVYFIDYSNCADIETVTLNKTKYGGSTPTIELDDVYNKVTFGANLYEVEDLIDDIFDSDNKTVVNEMKVATNNQAIYCDYYFSWRRWFQHTEDTNRYTMMIKPYLFVDSVLASTDPEHKYYQKSRWLAFNRSMSNNTAYTVSLQAKANADCKIYSDGNDTHMFVPQYISAYPCKMYTYSKAEGITNKTSVGWKEYIVIPELDYTHRDNYSLVSNQQPVLEYKNENSLVYSISEGTGYFVFNAFVFLQALLAIKDGPDKDVIYANVHNDNTNNDENVIVPVCMENLGFLFNNQEIVSRAKGTYYYNNGWTLLKCKLRVGTKYWNGTNWTTTESTFTLNYHDDDVNTDKETMTYFNWLKVCQNPNCKTIEVGKEGYAIPIKSTDHLHGDLQFTLYMPKQPLYNVGQETKTVPNFFLKDMSLEYVYNDGVSWADDKIDSDDPLYSDISPIGYYSDMEEIDLKINSFYKNKPVSKSYMLDENYNPVTTINGQVLEWRLVDKYLAHFGNNPKKVFNISYKITDINPRAKFYHAKTDSTYIVDSYEMNLQTGYTELKLKEL